MQTTKESLTTILRPYIQTIEKLIDGNISHLGPSSPLRDACEYALRNGGKRFRPALVLMIAKALQQKADISQAALAIEYFHTASLIADDLPCMDNDDQRRNKPTVHKVYGESIALLATYALISAGYNCLFELGKVLKTHHISEADHLCMLAVESVSYNTGLFGATGGQYLDITPPNLSLETVRNIIHQKTITLFEISFIFGWLFGGGSLEKLQLVKQAASHFGMAFQIADDIDDMVQDQAHDHSMNIANLFGQEFAFKMFHEEIRQFKMIQTELNLDSPDLYALGTYLEFLGSIKK